MHDARDAEDTRLLEAGEYGALVESYYRVMLDGSRISKISALGGLRGAGARRGRAFPVELLDHSAEVLSFGRGQGQPFDRRELEGALIWSHLCGGCLICSPGAISESQAAFSASRSARTCSIHQSIPR